MKTKRKIYEFNDPNICFSPCGVFKNNKPDGCTNYSLRQEDWKDVYSCAQNGIHFFCGKHKNYELVKKQPEECEFKREILWCDKCSQCSSDYEGELVDIRELEKKARIILQAEELQNAKLIRIDEQCCELKINKLRTEDKRYFSAGKIETDINGNLQINLYIGSSDEKKKAHFFIEPEVERLRVEINDNNIDPAKIISKITVELKDRKIIHDYNKEQ